MTEPSRFQKWYAGLSAEQKEALLARKRAREKRRKRAEGGDAHREKNRMRNRRWRERKSVSPTQKSALLFFASLHARGRSEPGVAALLKRYGKKTCVMMRSWLRAHTACCNHRKSGGKQTSWRRWNALRRKLRREWVRLTKTRGFAVLASHMLKMAAVQKKKKSRGGAGGEMDEDELAAVQRQCDVAASVRSLQKEVSQKLCISSSSS